MSNKKRNKGPKDETTGDSSKLTNITKDGGGGLPDPPGPKGTGMSVTAAPEMLRDGDPGQTDPPGPKGTGMAVKAPRKPARK
jgi:hypothetical protein